MLLEAFHIRSLAEMADVDLPRNQITGGWPGCVGLIVLVELATGIRAWVFWEEPQDEAGLALAGG